MIRIGIDTSVLIGLLDPVDIWHQPAEALVRGLVEIDANMAVFDCVLAEAISTMARRIHEQRRQQDLELLLERIGRKFPVEELLWVLPDVPALFPSIVGLVRESAGALNFNDALIALSSRRRHIPYIASFDRDFDSLAWLERVAQPSDLP